MAEEFSGEEWIGASEAVELVRRANQLSAIEARQKILQRAAAKLIEAKACKAVFYRGSEHETEEHFTIGPEFWRDGPGQYWNDPFWKTGDINTPMWGRPDIQVCFFNIVFRRSDIEHLLDKPSMPPVTSEIPAMASEQAVEATPPGRPATKHGDAIARVTLRLADLKGSDLAPYNKAEAVAQLLAVEYRALGQTLPSKPNLTTYAAGIIRALKARET